MSPSPVQSCSSAANLQAALTLLVALQRCGLKRLVLCPGSRSAPLAVAAGLLERTGLTLLTGVDERSAAFLALGLGRADGVPAAVVTTSGSAVANLLPAVVEADHGRAPLLLLSADRPARLKGCGANQTVNQEQFLAPCCRRFLSADPAGLAAMAPAAIEALAAGAWQAALQPPAGPVHLNLPLEEPLHGSAAEIAALEVAASGLPRPVAAPPLAAAAPAELPLDAALLELLDPDQPGAVVVGPWRAPARELEPFAAALIQWQRRSGWPVLADGCSGLRGWPGLELIHSYDLLLAPEHQLPAVPQLLRIGPMPSSRRLQQWITACEGTQLLLGQGDPRNLDATGSASQRWGGSLQQWLAAHTAAHPAALQPPAAAAQQQQLWRQREQQAQALLDQLLPAAGAATEPALARALSRCLPAGVPVMLASSSPVRDWESFSAPDGPQRPVFAFRGASGIDGTLSLAAGLACSHGQLVLLCGDLALLHDANGWLWCRQLQRLGVSLTVVLIENGGGGIFEQLPIRAGEPLDFERLFAMPQAIEHPRLAEAYGASARRLQSLEQLQGALAWARQQPMALLELRTNRVADAALRHALRRRMAQL